MYVKLRIVEGRQGSLELLFDQKRRLLPAFDHVVADLPVRAASGFGDECRGHRWGIAGRSYRSPVTVISVRAGPRPIWRPPLLLQRARRKEPDVSYIAQVHITGEEARF